MHASANRIDRPPSIRQFLVRTVARKMEPGERDPQATLDRLPESMPDGGVTRLAEVARGRGANTSP